MSDYLEPMGGAINNPFRQSAWKDANRELPPDNSYAITIYLGYIYSRAIWCSPNNYLENQKGKVVDKLEKKAKKLRKDILAQDCKADVIEVIRLDMQQVRNQALEDAEQKAEDYANEIVHKNWDKQAGALDVAERIRELKE